MEKVRIYGQKPYDIAVIHGGPGVLGEMTPVARELACNRGILEPMLTAKSIAEQISELFDLLTTYGTLPIILVGFSWGAMLSFIFTSQHPEKVKKLILIASGVYEDKYAADIMNTRLSRLSQQQKGEMLSIMEKLNTPASEYPQNTMKQVGNLLSISDSFDPLPVESDIIEYRHDVYSAVWKEVEQLRRSGQLLELGRKIQCSVIAIHGDYDPHPAQGIIEPLSRILTNFTYTILPNCGHYPWREIMARDAFYDILKRIIDS